MDAIYLWVPHVSEKNADYFLLLDQKINLYMEAYCVYWETDPEFLTTVKPVLNGTRA
jgi:hypothetical protein